MQKINDPAAAKRCARAIASDISLYNVEKLQEGLANDTLFELLKDEIEEGRQYYRNKVTEEVYNNYNFFDRALVDVLILGKGKVIKTKIW